MPRGYEVFESKYVSNAQQAVEDGVSRSTVEASGRVTGYSRTFRPRLDIDSSPVAHASSTTSFVSIYRSPAGARRALRKLVTALGRIASPGATYVQITLGPRLGDESQTYRIKAQRSTAEDDYGLGSKLAGYMIVWRQESTMAGVVSFGAAATTTARSTLRLARRQQSRLLR
jgi:hypothetical protein